MMPSNPGSLPDSVVEPEKLFRKTTLSNGSRAIVQNEGSVLQNDRLLMQQEHQTEEKRDYHHQQINDISEKQMNHIQNEYMLNTFKSSMASSSLSTSKSMLKSKELPNILGTTNRDQFPSTEHREFINHQNHRIEESTEKTDNFENGFRSLINQQVGNLPLPRETYAIPDLSDFSPNRSKVKPTSSTNPVIGNESQTKRVEYQTAERIQSTANSPHPAEDIVDTVMPLEGNQARLKLFDAPPWMKRATNSGVSPGSRTPGVSINQGVGISINTRSSAIVEEQHKSRASTSANGMTTFNFRQIDTTQTKPNSKRLSASESPKVNLIRENVITPNRNASASPGPRRTPGETASSKIERYLLFRLAITFLMVSTHNCHISFLSSLSWCFLMLKNRGYTTLYYGSSLVNCSCMKLA